MADPNTLTPLQEKSLMELEMILTTVKQIDSNLQKSIALLDSDTIPANYSALVATNTKRIKEILQILGASDD